MIWTILRWSDDNMMIMLDSCSLDKRRMFWRRNSPHKQFLMTAHDMMMTIIMMWMIWGWSYDEETHPTDNGLMNKQSQFSLSCALILLVVHVQLVHVGNRSFQNLVRKYTCSFVSVFVSGIWLEFDQISHRTFWTAVKEYLSVCIFVSVSVFVFLVSPWFVFVFVFL